MRIPHLLFAAIPAFVLAAPARAAVITIDPMLYPVHTDVSTSFPQLTLTRLSNAGGTTTYAPTMLPALIGRCTTYGACPDVGPLGTVGGNTYEMQSYRECYNANRLGLSSSFCVEAFKVLQATFASPTDFVEFQLTWYNDPPVLVGYNAAGDEILSCSLGSPTGCFTYQTMAVGDEHIGTVRLVSTAKIAKVVIGSYQGSAYIYGMQYSALKPVICHP